MKALFLLLLCSPVLADDLVYQSQTLAGTETEVDGGILLGPYSANSDVLTIDVQVSGPLAPNLNMAVITPIGWTVTCSRCGTLSSSPNNPNQTAATAAVFMFSTDATGKITNWTFSISGSFIDYSDSPAVILSQGSATFTSGDTYTSVDDMNPHVFKDSLSAPPGSWTQSSLSAPVQSAPAPVQRVQPSVRLWFLRL